MPVSVEIFGIRGDVYNAIRSRLQEELDHAGVDYAIHDVQQIDEFLREGLEGVPTVRIDHRRSFTKTDEISPVDFVTEIISYVQSLKTHYVVCPVDFSEASINAARWAHEFAELSHMQVRLMHVHRPLAETSYLLTDDQSMMLHDLEANLKKVSRQISQEAHTLPPETVVEVGDPLQSIVRVSKAPSTELIVMGTQGSSGITRRLFGTISAAVARHTYAPVLLIPPHTRFRKPGQIMIAFHEELVSNGSIRKIIHLNDPLQAHLQFVHVLEHPAKYDEIKGRLVEKLTSRTFPEFSFDVQEINADTSVLQALLEYAELNQPDIIVFITRHRNLVQRLLHPSLTMKMHSHLKWPLLILRNG
jgi:universal stress protein A